MNIPVQANPATHTAPDASVTPAPVAATVVRPALPRYVLRGVSGAGFGRTFPLVAPTLLGRGADCGIPLDHPGISRQHLRLTPTGEGLLVEDLGSTNGWLLNEQPQERAVARHGDEIGIDVFRFRVVAPGQADQAARPAGASARTPSPRHGSTAWWWVAALIVLAGVALLVLR